MERVRHYALSYTINVAFGIALLIVFGTIVATGRFAPYEPDPLIAIAEMTMGIVITIYGCYGLFALLPPPAPLRKPRSETKE